MTTVETEVFGGKKTCSNVTLLIADLTWTVPGSNPRFRDKIQATNRVSKARPCLLTDRHLKDKPVNVLSGEIAC